MVCVSSAEADYIAKNPFLTQYIELAMLALAQRASLIAFERQISYVSTKRKAEQKMMDAFICFQSQLLLPEVTPQQQGIELYDMLLETLYVNKEKSEVESRIRGLFELKTYRNEKLENGILSAVTFIGILSVIDVVLHWLGLIS